MSEMKTEEKSVLEVEPKEKQVSKNENISAPRSYESLWGALLFACMLIFVIASVASVSWWTYSQWKKNKLAKSEPSITVLSVQSAPEQSVSPSDEIKTGESEPVKQEEPANKGDVSVSAKKLAISVLNGGAVKGSAGTVVTFLKAEGYVSVTPGNTIKDYMGTTIYYAPSLEKEAEAMRATVAKKYPSAKILPADVKNKETSVSQVTIILGK